MKIKVGVRLFDNQKENIKQLVRKRKCILTDKCGGGKTLAVLYAFAYLQSKGKLKNLLVLTPLSALEKEVWKKDIVRFTTLNAIDVESLYKQVGDSNTRLQKCLDNYDVVYGKHTHLKKQQYSRLLAKISGLSSTLVCVDEIHAFRNPKSTLTLHLRDLLKNTKAFWGVTATTISRSIENLYYLVNLVFPWYLGSWEAFRDQYCNTQERVIGYDPVLKRKRKVIEATTLKNPELLRARLSPILITGESSLSVKFSYIDYDLSEQEKELYHKIASGVALEEDKDPEEWFKWLMNNSTTEANPRIGEVERYSSRFIYLQYAADGIIQNDGTYTRHGSIKMQQLCSLISEIVAKRQSVLVYFDYHAAVQVAKEMLEVACPNAVLFLSTGKDRLKEGALTEAKCRVKPHIVLCTRAASESTSYYFINNVVFFHIPTVPSTFIQMLGRITRKNTLYPDDLNCFIFRSNNIDLYKLLVVSGKTRLMENASGEYEANVPDDYKIVMEKEKSQDKYKRVLLWI